MKTPLKIGFFGTPELSACVLGDILNHPQFEVAFCVTNPDKKIGRKQILTPNPVKTLAQKHNIPVLTPEKIRNNIEFLDFLRIQNCDYFVVVAYGKILPKELLEIPKNICINVHGSILPKYRGASPIQSTLLNGETKTGVTIIQMSEGMDEGDMILVTEIDISHKETSQTLFEKFGKISGKSLINAILGYHEGKYQPKKQDENEATYCKKITKEDGKIDWNLSAKTIYHNWQGYTPWPGIYTFFEGKRLLLEKISFLEKFDGKQENSNGEDKIKNEKSSQNGTVFLYENMIAIKCQEGLIFPEIVKLEGKKSQKITDFINGNSNFINSIL